MNKEMLIEIRKDIEAFIKEEGIIAEEDIFEFVKELTPLGGRDGFKEVVSVILNCLCAEGKIYKKVHYCDREN